MPKINLDYYFILRVARTASSKDIKLAFRNRAKHLHPDANTTRNTTASFQALQEAYFVLSNPQRRRLYDQGDYVVTTTSPTQAAEKIWKAESCQECHCVSAQLRFITYESVVSLLFYYKSTTHSGIYCPKCASKKLFKASLITGFVGWTGVRGFFKSFSVCRTYIAGGNRNAAINAVVLARQSAYFSQEKDFKIAQLLATEAIKFEPHISSDTEDYKLGLDGIKLAKRLRVENADRNLRLVSKWDGWPLAGRYGLLGLSIPCLIWLVFFYTISSSHLFSFIDTSIKYFDKDVYYPKHSVGDTSSGSSTLNNFKILKTTTDHLMVASDGYTYSVSNADYQRLLLKLKSLQSRKLALDNEGRLLSQECASVEYAKNMYANRSLADRTGYEALQKKYLSKLPGYKKLNEDLNCDFDLFNFDLERVGKRYP